MPPTVKMKEKKQQSAEIRVQQEAVRQMQNATQGMNGANLMQGSRQEVQKTRFSVLEEEVMRIAGEANKQAALMAQQLTLVRNLKDLFETNQKKLIHQDNSRKISEADLKQFVAELQTEFNKNKIELLKTASTLCNLKREQLEKQIELTEEAMRQSNMEITDEWRDEAKASVLRATIRSLEIFTEGDLKDFQNVAIFDGSQMEDLKAELASVMRRIEFRKELDKGAKSIAVGAERHKRAGNPDGYRDVSGEVLNKMTLGFVDKFSDKQTREEMMNPVSIRENIERSLVMLDIWKADREKRSKRKLTREEKERFQRADQVMAYYEQHVNTVLGDYGMSLDRLAYSKANINELAKGTRNAERIDAWNKDYKSYQRLFDGNQENQNQDVEEGNLTAAEKRLCELERQAGIVNMLELKIEAPIYDLNSGKEFLAHLNKQEDSKKKNTFYSVFRLRKDVLSGTQDRKQVERKEVRFCYVCAKIMCDLKLANLGKEDLQFAEIPPLVNEMVRSYESYDIRSYVQRQQELREKLMEKLGQIQRTSPIFQERRYASLLLSYLHSEQMGELVKKSKGKEVRVYDKSYGGFDVQLEKKDRPYIDRLKSVKDEPLFAHDPMLKDIHQGALGDCYFLAALAGIVAKNPETIKEMMKDNGNGTVTVRFYDFVKDDGLLGDGRTYKKPYYVTVDKTIPERTYLDRHSKGDSYSKGALWVKMMEKAYSAVRDHDDKKYNHLKIRGKGETINYTEIESGQSHLALEHLTGESFYYYSDLKKNNPIRVKAFRGHFTGKASVVEGKILNSPSKLYFYQQHNRQGKDTEKIDENAKKYLAKKEFTDSGNLKAQFKEELDGYKTIETMMEKALLSRIQLMEIQAMDTETYVDTMENLGKYLEKLISQLKGCNGQELSDKLLDNLQDYDWEGNKTLRSKELKGGGRIRRKAFEDIGYEMIRNCWKVSGQNADKLLATIKEMLKTFTEALEAKNKGSIYTEAELNILGAFDEGLTAQKKCYFGTKKFESTAADGEGTAGEHTFKGICETHAYTVLSIEEHEINNVTKKFLRVQNPHGGNIPMYLIVENENKKAKVQRISNPIHRTDWIKFEKATNGVCLIELRDACSAMGIMSIV